MRTRQIKNNKLNAALYNMGGYRSRYSLGRRHNLGGMYSDPINPAMYADTVGGGIRKPAGPRGPVGAPPMPEQPPRPGTMQTGGMYADNTAAGAGQGGGPKETASIVYQEANPALQEQRLRGLEEEAGRLRAASQQAVGDVETAIAQGDIDAQNKAIEAYNQIQSTAGTVEGLAAAPYATKMAAGKSAALKGAMDAYRLQRAANLTQGLTQAQIAAGAGGKAAELATKAGGTITATAPGAASTVTAAGGQTVAGGASALGAGAKAFLSSGAGLGLVASGLGYGVKKLWADDDPTTADWGEVGGSALSGAGTGMAIGSVVPVIGTALGGIIGGLWGAGKSIFGARKAKRAQEKAEREHKAKVKKIVTKHNKDLMESYGAQRASVRAGELAQKTYSGYDLGRNVVAQMGGMRLGTPRYGYAA